MANILQATILTDFLYPFLLMFFITYALLQKSKILGEDNAQINAFVSLVISLIFVAVVFPVIVVNNLILFLAVGVVVVFVAMMFWTFINGTSDFGSLKMPLGIAALVAVVIAVLVITGVFPTIWDSIGIAFSWLFDSKRNSFWTNFIIVALVVLAVVAVLKGKGAATGKE